MRCLLPLLISLLALSAGCAAPRGQDPGEGDLADVPATGAEAEGASAGSPDSEGGEGAAPQEQQAGPAGAAHPAEPSAGAQGQSEPETPSWWSDAPVRRGDEVSVCAQATRPTLREARQQAIRAAYDRLEGELGGPAATAAIGSDYAATQEGDVWRFRVRVTGSRNDE